MKEVDNRPAVARRNLVILRAGDNSCHAGWLAGPHRSFDLFISYFGNQPDRYSGDAEWHENRKGPKWPILGELLLAHPELIERYDAFWLPDDDLATDTVVIDRMFELFHAHRLALAQPALTRDSYYTWKLVLCDPRFAIRYTRFVEVMAPIFDRQTLQICLPTFSASATGWGLDYLWPTLLDAGEHERIGIIDATPVRHTRPVGKGELYKQVAGGTNNSDIEQVFARYGLHERIKVEAKSRHGLAGLRRVSPGLLMRGWQWIFRKQWQWRLDRREKARLRRAV